MRGDKKHVIKMKDEKHDAVGRSWAYSLCV